MSRPVGPIEAKVRGDIASMVSAHPMGEGLSEVAFRLAQLLDGELQHMAIAAMTRELRETLLELARLEVSDDDDLDAELSRPSGASAVRDGEKL